MINLSSLAPPSTVGDDGSQSESINSLVGLLDLLRRRWLVFAVAILLCVAGMTVAAYMVKPTYTSTARIKLDPSARTTLGPTDNTYSTPDQSVVETEVAVIKSGEVARAVVNRLGLAYDPEFGGVKPADPSDKPVLEEDDFQSIIRQVQNHLVVGREGATYIVAISANSRSPAKAKAIANAFAEEYIIASRDDRVVTAEKQGKLLSDQAAAVRSELEATEARSAAYRGATGIVAGAVAGGTVTDQQIGAITAPLAQAKSDAAEARSKLEAARTQVAQGNFDSVSEVMQSPVVIDLRRQRTTLTTQQAQLSARYGPKHPDLARISQQLDQVDSEIAAEAKRIVAGLEATSSADDQRVAVLQSELGALRGAQARNASAAVEATSIDRDAEAKRTTLQNINQAAQQYSQQAQFSQPAAKIIGVASLPDAASFPNKPLFMALGGMMGIIFGAIGAFSAEAIENSVRTVKTVEDVEGGLKLPLLALAPLLSRGTLGRAGSGTQVGDYVVKKPFSSFAEALRSARGALASHRNKNGLATVIVMTSARPAEGKTTTSLSLARVMAMSKDRVLLIDCDLRSASLSKGIKNKPRAGLVEVLSGKARFSEAVAPDVVPGLDILPLSESHFALHDMFGGPAMRTLLDSQRSNYDFIVMDSSPIFATAESLSLVALADKAILAVCWGVTPVSAVTSALRRIEGKGATVLGVVLTKFDVRSKTSGDGVPHYQESAYSQYYRD